jgi:hypothetical protein
MAISSARCRGRRSAVSARASSRGRACSTKSVEGRSARFSIGRRRQSHPGRHLRMAGTRAHSGVAETQPHWRKGSLRRQVQPCGSGTDLPARSPRLRALRCKMTSSEPLRPRGRPCSHHDLGRQRPPRDHPTAPRSPLPDLAEQPAASATSPQTVGNGPTAFGRSSTECPEQVAAFERSPTDRVEQVAAFERSPTSVAGPRCVEPSGRAPLERLASVSGGYPSPSR